MTAREGTHAARTFICREETVEIDREKKLSLLKRMLLIRAFEEKAEALFQQKLIPGFVHLSIGQEASTTGSCMALRPDDYIISTHRGHAHILAKGAEPRYMFAELFGRTTGYCKGKGGSMHIADFSRGILGANGVVGGGFPIMVGAGLSIKLRKTDQVGMVFFGDGASNRGTFHEACNMAAVFKLPIIFVCENNGYASTSPSEKMVSGGSVAGRAKAYGIPGYITDGSDVLEVLDVVHEAVERARSGHGPAIVENETYRYKGHFEGDRQKYRSMDEIHMYRKNRDPIDKFERLLIEEGSLTKKALAELRAEVAAGIEEAVQFGLDSPLPEPEDALQDVFVNE
jgi:acetoin:2,6-dichlorophenolindophenol oxidoreductase subunit alpha